MSVAPLIWNVIYKDVPGRKISTYNVFRHTGMVEEIRIAFRRHKEKKAFAKELERIIDFSFQCNEAWKFYAYSLEGRTRQKVSVYSQIMDNWNAFLDYVWNAKEYKMFSRKPDYAKYSKSARAWEIVCDILGEEDKPISVVIGILVEHGFTEYMISRNREKWPLVQYEKDGTVYWHLPNKDESIIGDSSGEEI